MQKVVSRILYFLLAQRAFASFERMLLPVALMSQLGGHQPVQESLQNRMAIGSGGASQELPKPNLDDSSREEF